MTAVMDRAWREENIRRVKRMNELYKLDERDTDPNHPHKGTFTGLHQEILTYERLKEELEIYEKWNKRFAPMA
jgi:tRNA A37 N6-isopentenylltransferase MiaA